MGQAVGKKVVRKLTVEFDLNSAAVKPKYYRQLRKIAAILSTSPDSAALIEGHTDSTGNRRFNFRLSAQRATSVKNILVKFGADPAKLAAKGYGPSRPIADNATKEGRQKNRRTVTKVTVLIYR